MSLLPASLPLSPQGSHCCARGSPSVKIWLASLIGRLEHQLQMPSRSASQLTLHWLSPPRLSRGLRAQAPPDSHCHWLLPVANPRDQSRHAPPLLLLTQRVPADARCCLARGSSPASGAASRSSRCSRRPLGGSAALPVHRALARPAQPCSAKV